MQPDTEPCVDSSTVLPRGGGLWKAGKLSQGEILLRDWLEDQPESRLVEKIPCRFWRGWSGDEAARGDGWNVDVARAFVGGVYEQKLVRRIGLPSAFAGVGFGIAGVVAGFAGVPTAGVVPLMLGFCAGGIVSAMTTSPLGIVTGRLAKWRVDNALAKDAPDTSSGPRVDASAKNPRA